MTGTGPTPRDVAKVMARTIVRYRRGEIDERTAWRETSMLKALMDGLTKTAPEEPVLTFEQAHERLKQLREERRRLVGDISDEELDRRLDDFFENRKTASAAKKGDK